MPTLVALVVCLVEGREAVLCVCFSGKGHLGVGPREIRGGITYYLCLGVSVAPFECPTSMRRI